MRETEKGVSKIREENQEVQTIRYKIKKIQGYNVQHGAYSQNFCYKPETNIMCLNYALIKTSIHVVYLKHQM